MTVRKRFLAMLFALAMALTLLPMAVLAEEALAEREYPTSGKCGDNIDWYFQNDGTLLLNGSGQTYDYDWYDWANSTIPWSRLVNQIEFIRVQGNITHLRGYLFRDCTNVVGISLPKSLEKIDSDVFPAYCKNLQYFMMYGRGEFVVKGHVLYSDSGKTLYMYPPALNSTTFELPDGVTAVGGFSKNKYLEKITLNKDIKAISNNMFDGCSSLREVDIPSGVTKMDSSAFYFCDQLDTVVVPASVDSVHIWSFDGGGEDYTQHKDFYFCGNAPEFDDPDDSDAFSMGYLNGDPVHIRTDIYYPIGASGWKELAQRYEGRDYYRFIPYNPDDDGKLHGTVTVSANYAPEGEALVIRVAPEPGYRFASIKVTGPDGQQVQVSGSRGVYTFRMPAFDVFIDVDFVKN